MSKKKRIKETEIIKEETTKLDIYIFTILALTLLVPILVAPYLSENIFNLPKTLLMMLGAFLLLGIYSCRFVSGKTVFYPSTTTPLWLILIVGLNFISFFYTTNYYYTKVAAVMNLCALAILYFTSLNTDNKKASWFFIAIALSGIIVSIVAWLQYYNSSILPVWLVTGTKTTGLIGNSNYLGAYLLFVILSLTGLLFLLKTEIYIVIPILILILFTTVALIFAKTRAAWLALFFSLPLLLIFLRNIYSDFSILNYIKEYPKRIIATIIIIILIFSGLWYILPNRFLPDMKNRKNINTLVQRTQFFHASLELLKENPVFGTGLWSYRNGVYRAQARILETNRDFFRGKRTNKPKRVHNEYLEALNDGGFLAAGVLLMFFLTIMNHGLKVIRNQNAERSTRIIAATAFSMMVAIMIDAFFFFPFRINTTLFLTALTLGLLEGIYLNQYALIKETQPRPFPFHYASACIIILSLLSIFWFRGIRPFKAEMEHFKFRTALYYNQLNEAETHILKAISYDPGCTRYHVHAAMMYSNNFHNNARASEFIEESLVNFVGDNVLWGLYYTKGLIRFQMGSLFEARDLFKKSLYYDFQYEPSIKKLEELDQIFKEHDKICIKLK